MKALFSYEWLQSFFEEKLPEIDVFVDKIQTHFFEVENIEEKDGDTIIELDVLPSRTTDGLSHWGFAKEISAIFNLNIKKLYLKDKTDFDKDSDVEIESESTKRYTITEIEGIENRETPDWMKRRLEAIGQRSINLIVDITNYVLFEVGQPLHAFDKDKVSGKFLIRDARDGEKFTTLLGEKVELKSGDVLITDKSNDNILGLGGIKGGEIAEVDTNTKSIYLEAASFERSQIRKTMRRTNLLTDAGIRFSQGYEPELIDYTLKRAVELFEEFGGKVVSKTDRQKTKLNLNRKIGVSVSEINSVLGTRLNTRQVGEIFEKLRLRYKFLNGRAEFLVQARKLVGKPYKFGASVSFDAPNAFDCSSLISYCALLSGLQIPRVSVNQFLYSDKVEKPKPGDLVFVNNEDKNASKVYTESIFEEGFPITPGKVEKGINHCGIYIGDDKVIHAIGNSGVNKVEEVSIDDFKKRSPDVFEYRRIFKKRNLFGFDEKRFVIDVPVYRPDLSLYVDLIEEIGRFINYSKIKSSDKSKGGVPKINKSVAYEWKIINLISKLGFYNIINQSFTETGDIEVSYPVAKDKGGLRGNLKQNLLESMKLNTNNGELLGLSDVRLFEIGSVFTRTGERRHIAFVVGSVPGRAKVDKKKIEDEIREVFKSIGVNISGGFDNDGVWESEIDTKDAKDLKSYDYFDKIKSNKYIPFSKYPFVLRDISIFVDKSTKEKDVEKVIRENGGELLVRVGLFDTFEKDGKKSLAFRLVFQSNERTLNDEETLILMDNITKKIEERKWKVR